MKLVDVIFFFYYYFQNRDDLKEDIKAVKRRIKQMYGNGGIKIEYSIK